jgi:hypothetical protein
MVERALHGVGDASLGEWREQGARGVVHLRRRLSDDERASVGGLDVRDVRGTFEEKKRIQAVLHAAPHLRGVIA